MKYIVAVLIMLVIHTASVDAASMTLTVPLYVSALRDNSVDILSPSGVFTPVATFASGQSQGPMAVDGTGNIYIAIASTSGEVIDKVTRAGAVTTFDTGASNISAMTFDKGGNLYASEEVSGKIVKVTPAGVQTNFATLPEEAEALAFDSNGNLFADSFGGGNYVYKISANGTVTKFTTSSVSGESVAIDSLNNLYYTVGRTILKVTPTGAVSTFGTSSDGDDLLTGDAIDASGNLYVSDSNGNNGDSIGVFSPNGSYATLFSTPQISGVSELAVIPAAVPEPATLAFGLTALVLLLRAPRLKHIRSGPDAFSCKPRLI
jgi:hypothetical protein